MRPFTLGLAVVLLLGIGHAARARARAAPHPGRPLPGGALVAWSPAYRVGFFGLERLHPFDVGKADRVARHLLREGLVERGDFAVAEEVDGELLAAVHSPSHLGSLHDPRVLGEVLELRLPGWLPAPLLERKVLAPFRRQVQGSVLAARGAREHGFGLNLGGGLHHAHPARGHGFCVYNDIAVVIAALRRDGMEGPVPVVDTDVHQGDGTNAFFASDPEVYSLSLHQAGTFPLPRLPGDRDVELPAPLRDEDDLAVLDQELEAAGRAVPAPALVVHVAGADVLHDDPLAGLGLSIDGRVARDLRVLRWARAREAPLLHQLAGGYGRRAAEARARSAAAMRRALRGS